MLKYDVVIIGGGTAGAIAAVASGRNGLKTLLVEKMNSLGGTQTLGMVTPMMPLLIGDEKLQNISGINNEIVKRIEDVKMGRKLWFDPETLKIVLEEAVVSEGVQIMYDASFVESVTEDNKIKSVLLQSRGKKIEVAAKHFIDASGDAHLAAASGVEFEQGINNTKKSQPVSLRFEVGNVDIPKFVNYLKEMGQVDELEIDELHTAHTFDREWPLTQVFNEGFQKGILKEEDLKYFQAFSIPGKPGVIHLNCPELSNSIDVMNSIEISIEMIKGRQMIKRYMDFFKKMLPGFEGASLNQIAPMAGVRESRRIKGEYTLTREDVAKCRKFDDSVARSNWYMDIHGLSKEEWEALEEEQKIGQALPDSERYYDIPYRTLYSKTISNLLVVGRCISADFEAQSSMRIQPVCRALGEAAGHACKIATEYNIDLISVRGQEIQKKLRAFGAYY